MADWTRLLARLAIGQVPKSGRPARRGRAANRGDGWLIDPRNAVVLILASVLVLGGGRRWLQSRRARKAIDLLGAPGVSVEAIREASRHGRTGLHELFRILGTADDPSRREAAGRALADLWAQDQLIAEEEKAIVTRGYVVTWRARRRYPRALRGPIPLSVTFGVPFLEAEGAGVSPKNLQWSTRVKGAGRVHLEEFSPWTPGPGRIAFDLEPGDFATLGPHKLAFEARVRTVGLTDSWELNLPHIPFQFEFDPNLAVEALLALADDARAEAIARAVRLEPSEGPPSYLDLNDELALRDPPALAVAAPLPSDLAHAVEVEFEGVPGRFPAGEVLLSGQGMREPGPLEVRRFPLGPIRVPGIDRPGDYRLRAFLTADPDRGWADPDVRSIASGTIATEWADVRVIRR